jgi:hypothetical protein
LANIVQRSTDALIEYSLGIAYPANSRLLVDRMAIIVERITDALIEYYVGIEDPSSEISISVQRVLKCIYNNKMRVRA